MTSVKQEFLNVIPIVLLAIYSRELKAYVQTKTCIQIFIAVFFIIAEKQKKLKCPSTVEWINKMKYVYGMENYPTTERSEVLMHATI